jgi:hypothetical protein
MKLNELKIGDNIKFRHYYTDEIVIGILDKIGVNGEYHIYKTVSNTHRQWYRIFPNEMISKITFVEDPIEL